MTYFVGIDISKFKHDYCIINENGECIHQASITNDIEGFNSLLLFLNSLDITETKRIGFEATGHYGSNLKRFLDSKDLDYMEINPLLLKEFSKSLSLRRTKTDKKDASTIALYLSSHQYVPYPNKAYHMECLKSLARTRENLVKERSKQLVSITNALDKMFPEFKIFFNGSLKSASCMYLLHEYKTPSKMSRMNIESYNKMKSELRNPISYAKFSKLRELAKKTVGTEDSIILIELNVHLAIYDELNKQIELIESILEEEMSNIHSHIMSIKGVGLVYGSGIIAELGNVNRFRSSSALLAYAGLEPSNNDSGTHCGQGKMVKHGSSYLRMHLIRLAETVLPHNSLLYDYYKKKRNEGKAHNVALSHVAKKLVRIIYTLETRDIDFDISKMR